MIGLTSLELYNSTYNIIEENNKFELYTDNFESYFSFNEIKDKAAEMLGLSDITTEESQHEIYGTNIIKTYSKVSTEKCQTDGFYLFLLKFVNSSFRGLESNLTMLSPLDEIDIQLILKQYNSKVIPYKIPPGAYTFKDFSQVLPWGFKKQFELRKLQQNHVHDKSDYIIIENDNVTLITTLISRYEIKVLRFGKSSFLNIVTGVYHIGIIKIF